MFCEKCGAKNEDNAKFCEECGAILDTESTISAETSDVSKTTFTAPALDGNEPEVVFKNTPAEKVEIKPMSLKTKLILLVSGILVILCFSLYSIGKSITSPEKIVKKYFENISSKNYTEAFECIDIDSNEFTTKELFVKVMEKQNEKNNSEILNYTVTEKLDQNPLMKTFTVTYTQKGNSSTSTMNVTLIKQASKKWLFYDDYKIAENGLIAKECSITVPAVAEVYIDDIKVDESYVEKSSETTSTSQNNKTYVIPSIFEGTHTVKVKAPFAKEYVSDEHINNGERINVYSLELADASKEEVSKIAEDFVNKTITSAINKKSFDEIKTYFATNADMESIQEKYDDFAEKSINDEGVGVKSIAFDKFKSNPNKEYQSNSNYTVSLEYEYNYTALRKGWFDEEVSEYTPDRPQKGSANVYFTYENGKWMISDFYISVYLYY